MYKIDTQYMLDVLVRLLKTPSPSGSTHRAIDLAMSEFAKMGLVPQITRKGAILVTIKGKSSHMERALSGHVDTLGAMVKEIKKNGRVKFVPIGGFTMNSVEGDYCTIETSHGRQYTGTIVSIKPSVHVHRDGEKLERIPENMEIRLDARVSDEDEVLALGIEVGDFVYLDPKVVITPEGYVKSRHLDDKAGVAIILGAAKYLSEVEPPAVTTHLFISNYEEVGHGASTGIPASTEELIAVDMGAMGEGQSTDEYTVSICAKDSSGPYDLGLRMKLVQLAKEQSIGYKVDIYPYYGSDASAALRAGANMRTIVVGPGVDASHALERTHVDALYNTCALMLAYLLSV